VIYPNPGFPIYESQIKANGAVPVPIHLRESRAFNFDPQELADVSAYIEGLCIPAEHGKYDGADAAMQVAKGKELYEKQCLECHGKTGEGVKDKFYPVIAGQHYKYLLRQMTEIRDGHRRNANPDMVKVIKPYTNDQLVAISAFQSSLVMPGAMCKPKAGAAKKK